MAKYGLRILVDMKDTDGKSWKYSWVANRAAIRSVGFSNFYFIDTDTEVVYSASVAHDVINGMDLCDYTNNPVFTGSHGAGVSYSLSETFGSGDYQAVSASIVGSANTGSIRLTATEQDGYKLRRYKFFGEKVCSVLGFPENMWIYPENAVISNTGSEESRIRGNLQSRALAVTNTFSISNIGSITSDLPFKIDKQADRWLKWVNISSSANIYENNLLMGYNTENNTYELKNNLTATDEAKFVISASAMTLTNNGAVTLKLQELGGNSMYLSQHATDSFIIADDTLNIYTNGSEKMRIEPDGKVGIGTPNPAKTLHIKGNATNTDATIRLEPYDASSDSAVQFYDGATQKGIITWNEAEGFKINAGATSAVDHLVIAQDGKVGIGTASPASKLTVEGSISASAIRLYNAMDQIQFRASGSEQYFFMSKPQSGIAFGFYDQNFSYRMVIQSGSGNVGIGTTTPSAPLTIVADVGVSSSNNTAGTDQIRLRTNNNNYGAGIGFDDQIVGGGTWGEGNQTGHIRYYHANSQNDIGMGAIFKISSQVDLGLMVTGSGDGLIWCKGDIAATSDIISNYSDERLKNLEGPIPNALDKILTLNGYYFRENEVAKELGYDNPDRQVGLSAQEVEKILPEVVKKAPVDKKYKTIQYEKLIPLLIEGIKEQQLQREE